MMSRPDTKPSGKKRAWVVHVHKQTVEEITTKPCTIQEAWQHPEEVAAKTVQLEANVSVVSCWPK